MTLLVMVLVGYVIGLCTMTIISFYKWVLKFLVETK